MLSQPVNHLMMDDKLLILVSGFSKQGYMHQKELCMYVRS